MWLTRKHNKNLITDIVSFLSLILLTMTGIVMYFVLPHGSKDKEWLGLTRHEWGDVHFWVAILFVVIIGVHLVLHWKWIRHSLKH